MILMDQTQLMFFFRERVSNRKVAVYDFHDCSCGQAEESRIVIDQWRGGNFLDRERAW